MHLYSLTLNKPGSINQAVYGNFSSSKAQELLIAKGRMLELWRQEDKSKGRLRLLLSYDCFGLIRSVCPFRLTGTKRDYIIVGSDSGRIVILQYDGEKNEFSKVHQETYGKTGIRRIVPGQYIASDPKGRAVMISAIEKQKYVYILNRNSENQLTISSPLEAHKSHTIIIATTGVDVGYENPLFAVVESDYGDVDDADAPVKTGELHKNLTFYEMDLGLNHVVRKFTERIDPTASNIAYVPGDTEGPGGVIVFCEDKLVYKSYPPKTTIECKYPFRLGNESGNGVLINAFSFIKLKDKQKWQFFYLIQSEYGDIFKLQLKYTGNEVHSLRMQYIDTIAPATSLCILKTGYLFAAADSGNHGFYLLKSLGEGDKNPVVTTSQDPEELPASPFFPRALENLKLVDEWQNLSCISDIKIQDLVGEGSPQIYTLCAAGDRSSLRVLRHGIPVTEKAVSDLQHKPRSIWTIKESRDAEFDKYIILSFQTATFILLIGDKIKEVQDTSFETSEATLLVHLMSDNSIVQVYGSGVKHIKADGSVSQWKSKGGRITNATCNDKQVAISVQGKEIIYFEIDEVGNLSEIESTNLESEVLTMDIAEVPADRQRSKFLAIGHADNTVKLYSLDPGTVLMRLSSQSLPASPESVLLLEYDDPDFAYISDEDELNSDMLFLHIGLSNGGIFRTSINKTEGSLTETRTKFLGNKAVKLFRAKVEGRSVMIALSSRPWIGYMHRNTYMLTPLIYPPLDFLSGFQSSLCPNGLVGFVGKSLKIFKVDILGDLFSQTVMNLRYIPRKLLINDATQHLVILESSHRSYSEAVVAEKERLLVQQFPELTPPTKGTFRVIAPGGKWVSGVRVVSPFNMKTVDYKLMGENEAAVSMALVTFDRYKADTFLLVGTVKDYVMVPKSLSCSFIRTFLMNEKDKKLQLLHVTTMDGIPYSLAPHKGMVIAGIGGKLRLYDMGKKQLLKKCEYKHEFSGVNNILTCGERVFTTDISDSFHLMKHKSRENQFIEIADDVLPRWITTACLLDYHTIIGADKFENIFVCRLPESADEEINEDFYTYKFKWEAGYLNGAACKFEQICNYFFGEVITTMSKVQLSPTSSEVVIAGTSNGSLAVFYPFETKEELDFFVHLEMYLKMEHKPLSGRDHMAYRSYHGAVKNVIDGDHCEQFVSLGKEKQEMLALELDRTPVEVIKKLEDLKNRIL